MRRGFFVNCTVAVLALMLVVTPALAAKKKVPIKIGLLYALSGLAAVYTKGTVIGHEMAAEEINAKGGLLDGREIKYVVRDNKLKPGIAVKEFRRMVTRDKVDFVMGIISSGVALAVSQVAKEMKVLFVDTIAQTSALTGEQGHPYVVRTNTNSTIIGRTAALAAAKQPLKSFYFIGPDYEWGHVVNNDFWQFLKANKEGVSKVGGLWPKLGERDFSSHITTMINAKPDAVFSSLWGGDLIAFIKQAKAYGFFDKTQFISTGAGDLDILKPMGADMPDGIMATFLYAFDWLPVKQEENKKFVAEFKKRAGYEPKSGDIIGYVSTYMIAEAIERAGSTDTEALIKVLRGAEFKTLLGDVTIRDFDGQSTFSYNAGFTYTNPCYPFKRLKDITRAKGVEVLRTKAEVEKARMEYKKKGN
ncbi:Leucine-, isoleucine-, valine-, threonine-, and alanine-binding protein [Candidatus Entotheonellaceae bacterium PAL068K]